MQGRDVAESANLFATLYDFIEVEVGHESGAAVTPTGEQDAVYAGIADSIHEIGSPCFVVASEIEFFVKDVVGQCDFVSFMLEEFDSVGDFFHGQGGCGGCDSNV